MDEALMGGFGRVCARRFDADDMLYNHALP
jgi:hypothetical protein